MSVSSAAMIVSVKFLFLSGLMQWILLGQCTASVGPVFVNPANQVEVAPSASVDPGLFVTQTVYGFLDFTTTIGNTIMVFSPQSAAPVTPETPKTTPQPIVHTVIETKPVITEAPVVIKPSKTAPKPEKKASEPIAKKPAQPNTVPTPPITPSSQNQIKSVIQKAPASHVVIISSHVDVIAEVAPSQQIITKVEVVTEGVQPTRLEAPVIISSRVEVYEAPEEVDSIPSVVSQPEISLVSSVVELQTEEEEPAVIIGNNIGEPEYDFLSRQPSEVVEETYKVINLKPSSKFHLKPRPSADLKNKATKRADSLHPTGLVTKLGGTVVKDGTTTVHETSVLGTYISGKYAQVLQSTSHIYNNNNNQKANNKIHPTPSLRILKTAAPALAKNIKQHQRQNNIVLEPTPAASINEETQVHHPDNLAQNAIKNTRKPGSTGGFKRFKNQQRQREQDIEENEPSEVEVSQQQSYKKGGVRRGNNVQAANRSFKHNRAKNQNKNQNHNTTPPPKQPTQKYGRGKLATVSVYSESPVTVSSATASSKRYNTRRNKQARERTAAAVNGASTGQGVSQDSGSATGGFTRRGYKPRGSVQPNSVDQSSAASTSLYKFKLNRSPGRWQYKTTPKPRVTIRKQNDDEVNEATPSGIPDVSPLLNDVAVTPQISRSDEIIDGLVGSESVASAIHDESSTENRIDTPFPLETIKVEISTPPDFKDVYYEIATIKSPYTFQVGSVKNTRYITVTSTFEKILEPTGIDQISPSATEPLTENILATSTDYAKDDDNNFLDSSIATLPPLYLAADMETPPLETMIEIFSTTQTMLKTHILPIIRAGANDTTSQTLIQTYLITRLVTATKTLPPMEAYHFIPSRTLNEFNSHLDEAGSELHLELEFGDENDEDGGRPKRVFPPDLDLANIGLDFDLSAVDKAKLENHLRPKKAHAITTPKPQPQYMDPLMVQNGYSPEQIQQLAFLRLLNPGAAPAQQGQIITTSKPVIKLETIYESHVIPIVNGANTIFSTISKIVGTATKTEYELGTSTIPSLPIPPPVHQQLFPSQQQQFALTSSQVVYDTVLTQTESKILKLTFGAKTAQTTIYSTRLLPTKLTSYFTASIPVQATLPGPAGFPGYFPAPYNPAPYNPFPYVG